MTEKLIKTIKRTIRRRLKVFEFEEGIKLSLRLKKEKWEFVRELVEALNKSTIYIVKGYTLISDIVLPTPSGRILVLTFYISSTTYSAPKPSLRHFNKLLEERFKVKEPKFLIQFTFSLNSADAKYREFLMQKGLAQGDEYPREISFDIDKSEYELVEYLV